MSTPTPPRSPVGVSGVLCVSPPMRNGEENRPILLCPLPWKLLSFYKGHYPSSTTFVGEKVLRFLHSNCLHFPVSSISGPAAYTQLMIALHHQLSLCYNHTCCRSLPFQYALCSPHLNTDGSRFFMRLGVHFLCV